MNKVKIYVNIVFLAHHQGLCGHYLKSRGFSMLLLSVMLIKGMHTDQNVLQHDEIMDLKI